MPKYFKTTKGNKTIFSCVDEYKAIIVEHFENDKSIGSIEIVNKDYCETLFELLGKEPIKENDFFYAIGDTQAIIQNFVNNIR